MKKIVSMILSLMVICSSVVVFGAGTAVSDKITVTMDGEALEFDVEPVMENNRVLVPFRAIFEALGCNVTYTEADGKQFVTAMRGDHQLIIEIGSYDMCVNGNVEALDVPAVIKNDRTLVPVRAVSETFGANVKWIGDSKTVAVATKQGQHKIKAVTGGEDIKDENGTTLICITYSYPVIDNSEKKGYISQLNDEYKAYAQEFIREAEEHSEDARLMLEEMGADYRPMEFSLSYEVQTDRNDILSVTNYGYYDLGGAHPSTTRQSRTFDMANEKELALSDVVNGNEDERHTMVYDVFIKYFEENYEDFSAETAEIIDEEADNVKFYLTDDSLVLYFDVYQVGPYAMQYPTAKLSYSPGVFKLKGYTDQNTRVTEAVYLGVENYGAEEVNKDAKDNFRYRFEIDGKEEALKIYNGEKNSHDEYTYPIQNLIKEGYTYEIQIQDETVTAAAEKDGGLKTDYQPPVIGTPGEKTLKNLLATAFMPVGTTLYVYGGGWDWQDEGSAIQTRTIGIPDEWVRFFNSHDENYTYRDKDGDSEKKDPSSSYYPYGGYNEYYYAGLDCSGYIGWILYNVMNTESGLDGFVTASTKVAKSLEDNGWGTMTKVFEKPSDGKASSFHPGDIISIKGHVWMCVGTCGDGSILILHSTPAMSRTGQPGGGPELSAIGNSTECDAYRLADRYMSEYFPDWYSRYNVALKEYTAYTSMEAEKAGKFSWNLKGENGGLIDPDGYANMTPEEILEDLFKKRGTK